MAGTKGERGQYMSSLFLDPSESEIRPLLLFQPYLKLALINQVQYFVFDTIDYKAKKQLTNHIQKERKCDNQASKLYVKNIENVPKQILFQLFYLSVLMNLSDLG